MNNRDTISVTWGIDDVKSLEDSLTDEQARDILESVQRYHDASIGINWEVIQYHIDDYLGE